MTDKAAEIEVAETKLESALSAKLANETIEPGKHDALGMNSREAHGDQAKGLLAQTKIEIPENIAGQMKDLARPATLEQLSMEPKEQLARLYENSPAGKVPAGDMNGQAIFLPGSPLGAGLSGIADSIWKGKVFDDHGGLVNKILGHNLVKAEVFNGPSWVDGKPSTIIDYGKTSLLAGWIRDEVREVSPGLYLGVAYARLPFQHHAPVLYFALDGNKKH